MTTAKQFVKFLHCVVRGSHAFVNGVCSDCTAPEGGTTLADLMRETRAKVDEQIRPVCRLCWSHLSEPSAYLHHGADPTYPCARCGTIAVANEVVWVHKQYVGKLRF